MKSNKLFDYYIPYLFGKKSLIQKHVVDQSDYFFSRTENVENKGVKKFYDHLICSTMADGYEFFMDLLNSKSYRDRIGLIDDDKGKKMYKLNAMYYTIKFLDKSENMGESLNMVRNDMFKIFNFNKQDKKDFADFLTLHSKNESKFEADFSKYVVKNTIGNDGVNQASLAFVTNFFYGSYKSFVNSYNTYVSSRESGAGIAFAAV